MMKTEQKSYRLAPVTLERIRQLGEIWGPVATVSGANVIDECIKRVYIQETKKQEKRHVRHN